MAAPTLAYWHNIAPKTSPWGTILPQQPDYALSAAQFYLEQRDFPAMRQMLALLPQHYTSIKYLLQGNAALARSEIAEGFSCYQQAIATAPAWQKDKKLAICGRNLVAAGHLSLAFWLLQQSGGDSEKLRLSLLEQAIALGQWPRWKRCSRKPAAGFHILLQPFSIYCQNAIGTGKTCALRLNMPKKQRKQAHPATNMANIFVNSSWCCNYQNALTCICKTTPLFYLRRHLYMRFWSGTIWPPANMPRLGLAYSGLWLWHLMTIACDGYISNSAKMTRTIPLENFITSIIANNKDALDMEPDKYQYQVIDNSSWQPFFDKILYRRLLEMIPLSISANTLTLIGNLTGWLAVVLLLFLPQLSPVRHGLQALMLVGAALLFFVFVSLDVLDGRQARRTSGGTPWGEFLDHWLDSFNIAIFSLSQGIVLGMHVLGIGLLAMTALLVFTLQLLGYYHNRRFVHIAHSGFEGSIALIVVYLIYAVIITLVPMTHWLPIAGMLVIMSATALAQGISNVWYWRQVRAHAWQSLFYLFLMALLTITVYLNIGDNMNYLRQRQPQLEHPVEKHLLQPLAYYLSTPGRPDEQRSLDLYGFSLLMSLLSVRINGKYIIAILRRCQHNFPMDWWAFALILALFFWTLIPPDRLVIGGYRLVGYGWWLRQYI